MFETIHDGYTRVMASKRHQRRRSCESKIAYDNENNAYSAIRRMRKRQYSTFLSCYKCEFAGHFHIGAPAKKTRTNRIDKSWKRTGIKAL